MNGGSENLQGTDLTLQPAGEHGQSLQRRPQSTFKSRAARIVMAAAAVFGIGAGVKAEVPQKTAGIAVQTFRQVGEKIGELSEGKPTSVQVEANNILISTPRDQLVEGTIKKIVEDGKVLNANLRDKPSSFVSASGEPSDKTGKIIGKAEAGEKLKGIVVEGNNPLAPNNPGAHDAWLFTNEEVDKPQKGKFVHVGNLEPNSQILDATPLKLPSAK